MKIFGLNVMSNRDLFDRIRLAYRDGFLDGVEGELFSNGYWIHGDSRPWIERTTAEERATPAAPPPTDPAPREATDG